MFIRVGLDDTALGLSLVHTTLAIPFAVLITFSIFAGTDSQWRGCHLPASFVKLSSALTIGAFDAKVAHASPFSIPCPVTFARGTPPRKSALAKAWISSGFSPGPPWAWGIRIRIASVRSVGTSS